MRHQNLNFPLQRINFGRNAGQPAIPRSHLNICSYPHRRLSSKAGQGPLETVGSSLSQSGITLLGTFAQTLDVALPSFEKYTSNDFYCFPVARL